MKIRELTKAERREMRRLAGIAYERDLSNAATELQAQFQEWRDGKIDVFALNEQIHKYHHGISRELYKRYAMGQAHWAVASAIARDVLKETEVLPSILENLQSLIEWDRQMSKEDSSGADA
jgi:hypothetical protein